MKALTDALKTMLDALAHENAGEYLTPSQKTAELGGGSAVTTNQRIAPTVEEPLQVARQRVALFTGRELPADVMEYVTQTCTRLEHDLTVLTFESENTVKALLDPYMDGLDAAGIDMKLVTLGGNTLSQLARYLGSHPEIAFLACKESGYLGHSYMMGNKHKNEMPVPVVVIVANDEAAQLPGTDTGESAPSTRIA